MGFIDDVMSVPGIINKTTKTLYTYVIGSSACCFSIYFVINLETIGLFIN